MTSDADHRMYIGGQWCAAASGQTYPAMNPAKGKAFASVAQGDRTDAQRAIEAATEARAAWSATPLFERADLCLRMAEVIERRGDELADMLCTELGKPRHSEAVEEARLVPHFYRQAGEMARYLEGSTQLGRQARKRMTSFRRPRGVVAVITPWNFPAAIPSEYLPYAIVMGNTVAWTPAPTAAVTATLLMECLIEAGLPPGVINLVIGPGAEVGDELVVNPGTHAVGMTGSAATGRIISQRAGLKPRLMELGGNGPTVVLPDADPVKAARAVAGACFAAAGQVCSSTERIFVADNLKQPFVDEVVAQTKNWVQGDVWDEKVNMGPQNNMGVVEKVTAHIDDAKAKGATVVVGGDRPSLPGFFYEPTVLVDFAPDSLVNREETFGPVAPVRAFSSDDEAWSCIEACELGLVSAVFTENASLAWKWAERLRTGIVVINDMSEYWEPHIPFGGMAGNASGIGRLGGRHTLEFMSDLQTIAWHVD
ncbi:MAG: aldehyde dehydrogenase family protein [Phycisphaeraceae bacterium]